MSPIAPSVATIADSGLVRVANREREVDDAPGQQADDDAVDDGGTQALQAPRQFLLAFSAHILDADFGGRVNVTFLFGHVGSRKLARRSSAAPKPHYAENAKPRPCDATNVELERRTAGGGPPAG
jgi:hypothetical protein